MIFSLEWFKNYSICW